MSTVTTTTTATQPRQNTARIPSSSVVLRDYNLYHSGPASAKRSKQQSTAIPAATINQTSYENSRRRVPTYKPVNRNRNPAETNVYQNVAERIFINTMFAGLYFNAVSIVTTKEASMKVH